MISHEKFVELMADAKIYVNVVATMAFHDMNNSLAAVRTMILEEHSKAVTERTLKVLEASQIEEEDFFCHVTPFSTTYAKPMKMAKKVRRIPCPPTN